MHYHTHHSGCGPFALVLALVGCIIGIAFLAELLVAWIS